MRFITFNVAYCGCRARQTLPSEFAIIDEDTGGTNVMCVKDIKAKTRFGPLMAPIISSSPLQSDNNVVNNQNLTELEIISKEGLRTKLDLTNENQCNWLCLIGLATSKHEQNCMMYQLANDIYYTTMRDLRPGEQLKAWYAAGYARKLGKPEEPVQQPSIVQPYTAIIGSEQEEAPSTEGLYSVMFWVFVI